MQASRETAHPGDIRGELFAQTIEKQAKRLQKQDGIGLYGLIMEIIERALLPLQQIQSRKTAWFIASELRL